MRKLNHAAMLAGPAAGLLFASASGAEEAPDIPAPPQATAGLQEITVTARRVEENLQNVPTAVTAIGASDLKELRIEGFQQLNGMAPNVNIQKQAGSPIAPQFNIRGVTTGNLDLQSDAGIGLYIDGVYVGRPASSGFDMADLERVEVLRGPQGTLFGRNATGGAISITTAPPTGQFDLHGEVDFGNYQLRKQKGSIDLPRWNGLAVRITLAHSEHAGYVRNTAPSVTYQFSAPFGGYTTSNQYGDAYTNTFLGAVNYTGIEHLTVDYKFDYTYWTGTMDGRQLLSTDPSFFLPGALGGVDFANQPAHGGTNVVSLKFLDAYPSNFDSPSRATIYGHSLTANYEINNHLAIKNIAGYRSESTRAGLNNLDGNAFVDPTFATTRPFTTLGAVRSEHQHQISDELQLIGNAGPVDWITGLFYFDEKGGVNNPVAIGGITGPWSLTSVNAITGADYIAGQQTDIDNESEAAYAHAVWHVADAVDLAGGVRYTRDKRSELILQDFSTFLYGLSGGFAGFAPGSKFHYTGNRTDYDAEATYKIDPTMNVYAKTASGFISGGVTSGARFAPETITSYEIGLKSELLEHTLRLNAAAFYQNREHLQVLGFTAPPGTFIFDGGKEKDSGVELETTYVPVEHLTLNGSFGYTHAQNDAGVRSFQPKYTASLGGNYDFPRLANGLLPKFRVDANYRSDQYRLPCPSGVAEDPKLACQVKPTDTPNPTLDRELILKGEVTLGARLSLAEIALGDRATGSISFWVQNLLDNHKFAYLFPVTGVQAVGTFENPRTFGVDFNVDL
jgi:iron complex outermembrane recepter protein